FEGQHRELAKNMGVPVQHVDQGQVVALAHFIVVEVVGGGDLDAAGTEFPVNIFVSDNGNQTVDDGQVNVLADQVLVALVFRMHGHGGVAQHGFRTGGGHNQVSGAIFQGITQVPERAFFFFRQHFQI